MGERAQSALVVQALEHLLVTHHAALSQVFQLVHKSLRGPSDVPLLRVDRDLVEVIDFQHCLHGQFTFLDDVKDVRGLPHVINLVALGELLLLKKGVEVNHLRPRQVAEKIKFGQELLLLQVLFHLIGVKDVLVVFFGKLQTPSVLHCHHE